MVTKPTVVAAGAAVAVGVAGLAIYLLTRCPGQIRCHVTPQWQGCIGYADGVDPDDPDARPAFEIRRQMVPGRGELIPTSTFFFVSWESGSARIVAVGREGLDSLRDAVKLVDLRQEARKWFDCLYGSALRALPNPNPKLPNPDPNPPQGRAVQLDIPIRVEVDLPIPRHSDTRMRSGSVG